MSSRTEEDVMLKLVHTADWHLGRAFRSFPEEAALKLSRARIDVLDRILQSADRNGADAILCAGDLFDEPHPERVWWEEVATRLRKAGGERPIFLLPGNHDPLTNDSVWAKEHAFRSLLPAWVHVVDRDDFEFEFPCGAVLYAVPCRSKAGQRDPTDSIPPRARGDARIRIGMVHGSTFDAKDWQTNFPLARDAARARGLDYLALGDTHGFRFVPPDCKVPPTVYPGAPEPTAFDEKDPGSVAVVFINRQRVAMVRAERVAYWTWEEHIVTSMAQLRELASRADLASRVLRLVIRMEVAAPDYDEAEALIESLQGTAARHARAGVLALDREGLALETRTVSQHCTDLPSVLQAAVTRLQQAAESDPSRRLVAERALYHLYRTAKRKRA
jgi:DNA repair exonuclease SbcCD nuclease subunit